MGDLPVEIGTGALPCAGVLSRRPWCLMAMGLQIMNRN